METKLSDARSNYRRNGQDRRRLARASQRKRRDLRDRRSKDMTAFTRLGTHGPKPPQPEPEPLPSRISLYDLTLRSLGKMQPHALAAKLADLKLAGSEAAAFEMLAQTPAFLARYLSEKTAQAVCSQLRPSGADVAVQVAQVTCPHCRFSVPCEGEASSSRGGVTFTCPSCQGLILLDLRDSKFHPLLRCSDCASLLRLQATARPGNYRCQCGGILRYEGLRPKIEFAAAPDPEPAHSASRPSRRPESLRPDQWL